MKKMWIFIAVLLLSALMAVLLVSCGEDTPGTQPEQTETDGTGENTPEDVKPVYQVIHRDNVNPAYDWTRSSHPFKNEDGSKGVVWWNVANCLKMGVDFINVFPNYNANGQSIDGAQLTGGHYEAILKECQPGLDYSHQKGIRVVTTLPMALMYYKQYEAAGEDWKQYAGVRPNGSYAMDSSEPLAYACANNPLFREKIRTATIQAAQAGYDGVFYDAGPYSYGAHFNCSCKYCKKAWAELTTEYYGKSVAMPTSDPDLGTETGRLLWKWRHDIFIDFMFELRDECRKINPDFNVWPNIGMNATHSCYYTLKGLETSMNEYNSNEMTNPGVDSTLYFFRQYEAENPANFMMMQFGDIDSQATPDYKFHTAYVEGMAGDGAVMAVASNQRTSQFGDFIARCNTIRQDNLEAFCDSVSIADTAIVYSWQEINTYHLRKGESPYFDENAPRRAASMLAQEGIPFDYIMPERVTSLADLQKYKTLIFADYYLIDKEFEPLLTDYIRQGGQVIVLGAEFAKQYTVNYGVKYADWEESVFSKWTGKTYAEADADGSGEYFEVGEGYVYALKSYLRGKNTVKQETLDLFDYAELYDLVRVTEDVSGEVETTLRSNAASTRWWLHCITYASKGKYDDKPITVEVRIPEGEKVTSVSGVSPTLTDDEIGLSWEQTGTTLTITATVGLYTMFTIEKQAS